MSDSVRASLHTFFRERYGLSEAELASDLRLSQFMDSIGFMDLIAYLEQQLGVRIDMMQISDETFGTLAAVERFLEALRAART